MPDFSTVILFPDACNSLVVFFVLLFSYDARSLHTKRECYTIKMTMTICCSITLGAAQE